jgi:hypothetical protein
MKKLVTTLALFAGIIATAFAQHCGASYTVTTGAVPIAPTGFPGFTPTSLNLPGLVNGVYVSDTINFENYTTLANGSIVVDSLKFDEINNLPAGLCWETNKSSNTFQSGETGVIVVSGIPSGAAGQYKLVMIIDMTTTVIGNEDSVNFEDITNQLSDTPVRYYLRLDCPGGAVEPVDTVRETPLDSIFFAYSSCAGAPTAAITSSGSTNLCPGGTDTLTATAGAGYTYLWSTADTSSAIVVSGSGSYTVTVTYNLLSTIATPVTITVDTLSAHFTMIPDTIPHSWLAINESAQGTGGLLDFLWSWGDGSTSTGAYPTHLYTAPGYYNICVTTSDTVCSVTYCDSSTYVYKTDGTVISVVVISPAQVPNGINAIGRNQIKAYPNPASHMLTVESSVPLTNGAVIYDDLGRAIKEVSLSSASTNIDVSMLIDGVYTLSFKDSAVHAIRFVVTR